MARTRDTTAELKKYIFAQYIWMGKGQATIMRQIENDASLKQRFGDVSAATMSYHVKAINEELEESVDYDAMDKFVGEYLRYQQSLDNEIGETEEVIKLLDKEKDPVIWLSLKRFKKDLLDSRMKALADHELPLAVKKMKAERKARKDVILNLQQDPKELEDGQRVN